MHIPMACQAIEAGCHVLTEKPLSDTIDGIDELERWRPAAARRSWSPSAFATTTDCSGPRSIWTPGRIGRLVSIRALMGEHLPDIRPDYRTLYLAQYNGAFELMHDLDLALWYAGQPVKKRSLRLRNLQRHRHPIARRGRVSARFRGSLHGHRASGLLPAAAPPADGIDRHERRHHGGIRPMGPLHRIALRSGQEAWEQEELTTDRDDMFRAEDREFLEAVAEDQPISCTIAGAQIARRGAGGSRRP